MPIKQFWSRRAVVAATAAGVMTYGYRHYRANQSLHWKCRGIAANITEPSAPPTHRAKQELDSTMCGAVIFSPNAPSEESTSTRPRVTQYLGKGGRGGFSGM